MEAKIKQLKDLVIARQIAMNWDYVPEPSTENVHEISILFPNITFGEIESICREYEGSSDTSIENKICDIIETL